MKKYLLSLIVILLPVTALAESVSCVSENGEWQVTLELTASEASAINIARNGISVAKFTQASVKSYRFPKKIMNYEIELSMGRYLNIYRDMEVKIPGKTASAVFYLAKHPFALEKHAENCSFN
jgi:pyridoxine 5'-phosphate synthase PdxJ